MITIIDYNVGNLGAIQNMFKKSGFETFVTSNLDKIAQADKLVLPGVGAYDSAISKIEELEMRDPIHAAAQKGSFILGICLGAQLMLEYSDEGTKPGLSLINGHCKKFDVTEINPLRVPHMSWGDVTFTKSDSPLADFSGEHPRFYFTHSYYFSCKHQEDILAKSSYGIEFTSAFNRGNIYGVQFHPEKSHVFGEKLLTNFGNL